MVQYELGVVNLEQVLTFQPLVSLEGIEERVGTVTQDDWDQLFSTCLPDAKSDEKLGVMINQADKSYTLSSLNPNLRILGLTRGTQDSWKTVGFVVGVHPSFVQVAECNGRWFVRDGYHRCYGLLRRGITRIPCVFVRARNFAETGAEQPGFLKYEQVFSSRPPLLKDFFDDAVSVTVQHRALRKVVRIRGEEFFVEV